MTTNLELLIDYLLRYGMNVIGAILTLIAGYLIAGWVSRLSDAAMRRAGRIDPVFHQLPGKIVRVVVNGFGTRDLQISPIII